MYQSGLPPAAQSARATEFSVAFIVHDSFVAHSPDNTFMGFVVALPEVNGHAPVRLNQALVYGKLASMWKVCLCYVHVAILSHGSESWF